MFRLGLEDRRRHLRQRNGSAGRAVQLPSDLPDTELLTTVPGIGPINAMTILAEGAPVMRSSCWTPLGQVQWTMGQAHWRTIFAVSNTIAWS